MTTAAPEPDPFAISQRPLIVAVHAASEFVASLALFGGVFAVSAFAIFPYLSRGPESAAASAVAVALLVVAIVKSPLGSLSGAHMNPAVSFAFWAQGSLSLRELAAYAAAQLSGALAAAALMRSLAPEAFAAVGEGLTHPSPALSPIVAFGVEATATLGLVSLLFLMMSERRLTTLTAFVKGLYLGGAVFWLQALTGPSLNPARSWGPALVSGRLDGQWLYLAAPLVGAAAATLLHALAPALPRPRFHRFNHDHAHPHYAQHLIDRLAALAATTIRAAALAWRT